MARQEQRKLASIGVFSLIVLSGLNAVAFAQTAKLQGMIKGRSGATMTVQSKDSSSVVVLLTDGTRVDQSQGVLKVRKKEMAMTALIPGLEVQVQGTYNDEHQLVAESVKFNGDDLERAQAIQAGLHETHAQGTRNREDLEKNREELEKQSAELNAQAANIASNKAAIEAGLARFGQLDDYYILDEVTVLFGNGQADIEDQYKPQLMELVKKAKAVDAYMIQVVGYASSSGSVAANQKLSQARAENVSNFLAQDAETPLTNLLAPGAMGESRQVGDEQTAEGQAQNRRVVVRILQNKAVAELSGKH
jgi:outer membrane protein OmpA-like peptidoglycan-associated protein